MTIGKWDRVALRDICELINYGYTASAKPEPIGPKFLRITDIVPDRIDWTSVPFCKINEKDIGKYRLEKGDIVIARTGSIGYAKRIRDKHEAVFASYLVRIRVNRKCDNRYVGFVIESNDYKQFIHQNVGGTAQPQANAQVLTSFQIPLPPLPVQRKIADILSAYDELIKINQQRIALLERAGREIYREWFVRLRFPGHERTKIVDGVPETWERVHLSRLVSTQYGYTASANEEPVGPKFLRGTDINKRSYVDWATVPYCPEDGLDFEKYALKQGDLLVIRMADPGKVAIIEKEIRAIFASYLVRLSVQNGAMIDPFYLFYVLAGAEYQGFMQAASAGSTRKSASAKLLTNFNVLRPPEAIQTRFVDQIRPMREMIGTLLDQNSRASMARDLLLPRLMSGQLMV